MSNKVYIKYGFIFDPSVLWSTQAQFEEDLGRFFLSKGMRPEIVEAAPGQEQTTIIYLNKTSPLQNVEKEPVEFEVKGQNGKPVGNPGSK